MILHTGGCAFGAIFTRSRSFSIAISIASFADIMPSCAPSGPITLTSLSRTSSLISRSLLLIVHYLQNKNERNTTCSRSRKKLFLACNHISAFSLANAAEGEGGTALLFVFLCIIHHIFPVVKYPMQNFSEYFTTKYVQLAQKLLTKAIEIPA